jgi:hypothetical protein
MITVRAQLVESPETEQHVTAQWMQTPPAFEVSVQPIKHRGENEGIYTVNLKNLGDSEIKLQLTGVDANNACTYIFSPATLVIPPLQEGKSQLNLRPKQAIYTESSKHHPFQVSASPPHSPALEKRVDSTWEQIPSVKSGSLFLCWLLIALGWAMAMFLGVLVAYIFEEFVGMTLGGVITGGIGGFMTGLGLRAAERKIKFSHILGLIVGFAAVWSIVYILFYLVLAI